MPLGIALDEALTKGNNLPVTKAIARLSVEQLERDRREVDRLNAELESLRASWRWANENNPEECERIKQRGLAVKDRLMEFSAQVTLGHYRRHNLEQQIVDEIQLLICWALEHLNLPGMNEEQIHGAAYLIVNLHGGLRKEDVAVAFKNAISGKYGPLYGKIDSVDLLRWLDAYKVELDEIRMKEHDEKHMATKGSQWDAKVNRGLRAKFHNMNHGN